LGGKRVYSAIVDAMQAFLHEIEPDLAWIHDIKLATTPEIAYTDKANGLVYDWTHSSVSWEILLRFDQFFFAEYVAFPVEYVTVFTQFYQNIYIIISFFRADYLYSKKMVNFTQKYV
jgi:hypothetical protein